MTKDRITVPLHHKLLLITKTLCKSGELKIELKKFFSQSSLKYKTF